MSYRLIVTRPTGTQYQSSTEPLPDREAVGMEALKVLARQNVAYGRGGMEFGWQVRDAALGTTLTYGQTGFGFCVDHFEPQAAEVERLRARVAELETATEHSLCPSNTPSGEPDTAHWCALPAGHAVPLHQSKYGTVWTEREAERRNPARHVAELEAATQPTLYLALYEGAEPELFTTEQAARDCCDDLAKAEANGRCWDWMRPDENGVVEQWWVHEDNDAPTYATGGVIMPVTPHSA
ncbi:hypothetical protein [Peterkaempfera griseoplana]|uniref:hypothetical protein n=1 Tax=Peterkaempfera griseoplana TaxID=66896 RepID=UPI0006E432A1|nr:hypothetical protein [Peterkaempfera griseoplana]